MKAFIKNKSEIAKGTLQVEFETAEDVDFKPGQYMDILLINPPYSDEKGPKRHFSITNTPKQKRTLVMATRLRDSAFKKSLQQMPIGTEVEITRIGGNFILPVDNTRPLVFIAGGIGITPFMSMLRSIQEDSLPYQVTLIYSNRDLSSTAFYEELNTISSQNPNIKIIFTMTEDPNWTKEKTRVDVNFIKKYILNPNGYTYMVAGPPPMVDAVLLELQKTGVEPVNIIKENFSGY